MVQPKVSIVIPIFNVEQYLRPCIESALAQTLREIEIICVDDGSTDASSQILDIYAAQDSRIKVIHKENGGYGKAVNTGMDHATGEYFAILEGDDIVPIRMYETLYRIAKENDLDIIKSDFCRFTTEDGVFTPKNARIAKKPDMYGKVIVEEPVRVIHDAFLYTWSGIYKMDFLRKNALRHNETPGASYQDNGFWFLTMSKAKRVWFHDEVFYMLRRDNPNSSIYSTKKVYCIRDEYEYILKELKKDPVLYKQMIGEYWWARFKVYRWTYIRIASEYKLEFAKHYSETMKIPLALNELDFSLFSKEWLRELRILTDNYEEYPRGGAFKRLKWFYEDNGFWNTVKHVVGKSRRLLSEKLYSDKKQK